MEEPILYELMPCINKACVCIDDEESYTNTSSKTSKLSNLEQFSIDCRKTKTKLITYQLDY